MLRLIQYAYVLLCHRDDHVEKPALLTVPERVIFAQNIVEDRIVFHCGREPVCAGVAVQQYHTFSLQTLRLVYGQERVLLAVNGNGCAVSFFLHHKPSARVMEQINVKSVTAKEQQVSFAAVLRLFPTHNGLDVSIVYTRALGVPVAPAHKRLALQLCVLRLKAADSLPFLVRFLENEV